MSDQKKKTPEQSSADKPAEVAPKKLKGLCINCDYRDTCTLPKPETGVWFCEEYR